MITLSAQNKPNRIRTKIMKIYRKFDQNAFQGLNCAHYCDKNTLH